MTDTPRARTITETIELRMPDGVAEALVVRPDDGEPHPGILYYPDVMGVRPAFQRMAERVASWGYVVLVPNYFYRMGSAAELEPTIDLRTPEGWAKLPELGMSDRISSVSREIAVADGAVFVDALRELPGVTGERVATTGYCFGGLQAMRAAEARPDAVAAVAGIHTGRLATDSPDSVHLHFGETRAEYYLGHADQDPSATPEIIATAEEALRDAGRAFSSDVYEGALHGFAVPDLRPYDEAAAELHYRRIRDLYARTLG